MEGVLDMGVFDTMSVEDIWMVLNGGGATEVTLEQVLAHLHVVDRRGDAGDREARPLQRFKTLLVECLGGMTAAELSELVCFITGSPQLLGGEPGDGNGTRNADPNGAAGGVGRVGAGLDEARGEEEQPHLAVHVQDASERLPHAQSCFSQVFVPFYHDVSTLKRKLRQAIQTQEFGLL